MQVIDDGVLERHLYAVPFATDGFNMEAVKSELAPTNRYFCSQDWIRVPKDEEDLKREEGFSCHSQARGCSKLKKVKGKGHLDIRDYSEQVKAFRGRQYRKFGDLKNKRLVNYLDPVCLKGESECDIRKVYPCLLYTSDAADE